MPATKPSAGMVTAVQIAKTYGLDPKTLRAALRKAGLRWHQHGAPWEGERGGDRHADMERIAGHLLSR